MIIVISEIYGNKRIGKDEAVADPREDETDIDFLHRPKAIIRSVRRHKGVVPDWIEKGCSSMMSSWDE